MSEEAKNKLLNSYLVKNGPGNTKFVLMEDIDKLNVRSSDKKILIDLFKQNDIEVLNSTEIKKERPSTVRDNNYGEVKTNEMQIMDLPDKAKMSIELDSAYEIDYTDLIEFLENVFIPRELRKKTNRNGKAAVDIEKGEEYDSIQLNRILALKLSEDETEFIINYLKEKNIRVAGYSPNFTYEFDNYDQVRNYSNYVVKAAEEMFTKKLTSEELDELFKKYYGTKDPLLFEELVYRNIRLVPYTVYKFTNFDLEKEMLESIGYEGLMQAVKNFNPFFGYKFSTYAINCIKWKIQNTIAQNNYYNNISSSAHNFYIIRDVIRTVEEEYEKPFDGSKEMVEDIIDLLKNQGLVSNKLLKDIENKLLLNNAFSIEKLKEDISDADDRIEDIESSDEYMPESYEVDDKFDYDDGGKNFSEIYKEEYKKMQDSILNQLKPRERQVLEYRFGLKDGIVRTLNEVATIFGIKSPEYIRRVECIALRKLRNPVRSKLVKPWIETDYEDFDDDQYTYSPENKKF